MLLINETKHPTQLILDDTRVGDWLDSFRRNVHSINSLRFAGIITKTPSVIHSVLIEVNFLKDDLTFIRSVLIRGRAVVVIVVLPGNSLNDSRFLVVRQTRVSTGQESYEFPSGLQEANSIDSGIRELKEETGIDACARQLIGLKKEVRVCESALDETADWYIFETNSDAISIGTFGIIEDGERTRTELISWQQLCSINTFHMLTARSLLIDYYYPNLDDLIRRDLRK